MKRFGALLLLLLLLTTVSRAQPGVWGLDSAFGKNGVMADSFPAGQLRRIDALTVQPDGRILTVGCTVNRYLSEGRIDSTFALAGRSGSIDSGPLNVFNENRVYLRGNGKSIVLAHHFYKAVITQFLPSGQLDSSFGTYGVVRLADTLTMRAGVLNPDSSLILVGASTSRTVLIKLEPNGKPDLSFGNAGVFYPSLDCSPSLENVTLQPDGKILAVGTYYSPAPQQDAIVVRFHPDGSLDSTFGQDGLVFLPVQLGLALQLQPDGKILVATGRNTQTAVMRLLPNGSVDLAYGQLGTVSFSGSVERFGGMALLASGKLLWAGGDTTFKIARILPDGRFDTSFGVGGMLEVLPDTGYGTALSTTVQQDGRILIGGYRWGMGIHLAAMLVRLVGPLDPPLAAPSRQEAIQDLRLYPNPVQRSLTISGSTASLQSIAGAPYAIVNPVGQILQRGILKSSPGAALDVQTLPPGLYYIRLPHTALPFLKH